MENFEFYENIFVLNGLRRQIFSKHLEELGLSRGQPRILYCLMKKEHITQKELADTCLLDSATLSRGIDKLEKNGYIIRTVSPESRRCYFLELTDKGRQSAEKVQKVYEEINAQMSLNFTPEEINLLNSMLKKAIRNIE